jgi:hypothetical protein
LISMARDGAPTPCTGRDGLAVLEAIEGIEAALKSGRSTKLGHP